MKNALFYTLLDITNDIKLHLGISIGRIILKDNSHVEFRSIEELNRIISFEYGNIINIVFYK